MNNLKALKRIKIINEELEKLEKIEAPKPSSNIYINRNFYTDTAFDMLCRGDINPELFLDRTKKDVEIFKQMSDFFLSVYNYYIQKQENSNKIEELKKEKLELEKILGL